MRLRRIYKSNFTQGRKYHSFTNSSMMSLTHFIFYMLVLTTCNGIKCVDKIQMQLLTSEIASTGMKTIFRDLKTTSSMSCQVHMEFDSIAQKFTINFGQHLVVPRLRSIENTYIQITTSIIAAQSEMDMNQTSIKTVVRIVCYSNDQCDRQLVQEHINRLITTNYTDLESIIRPMMLVQGDKKSKNNSINLYRLRNLHTFFYLDECTVGSENTVQPCDTNACSWYYSMNTKQSEGKCESVSSPILPILKLTNEIRMFEKLKKQEDNETKPIRAIFKNELSIKLWCELNNCNNQEVRDLIKDVVSKDNDLCATHII